jgi:hypothetical protein
LAIILIVFLFFYFYPGKNEEIKTRTDVISKPSSVPSVPTGETIVQPPLPEEMAGGEKTLLVKTSETTWLKVQIDDKPPFEVILKPGENLTWNALHTLKLSIGNAGGIDLFYNGKALGKLGNSGQVASITLPNEKIR